VNLARARELILSGGGPPPAIVVFPEMALTGYLWSSAAEIMPYAVKCSDPETQAQWVAVAKECGSWLVIGHPAFDSSTGKLTNRCTLVSPTSVLGHYDKTCLFVEDLSWATAGDAVPPLWETPIGTAAPLICADLDYPEPIESAVERGAQAILFSTAWVAEPAPSATWTIRAAEYGVPIIAADIIGTDRTTVFSGGSCIIDSNGAVVTSNDYDECLVSAELDVFSGTAPEEPATKPLNIAVHSLKVADAAFTPKNISISVWSGDSSEVPPPPVHADEHLQLVVLPTTSDCREEWLAEKQAYASLHNALVVQGRRTSATDTAVIVIVTPKSGYFEFSPTETKSAVALLDIGGVLIGVTPNAGLESHAIPHALSRLGASIVLGQGAHSLRPPRQFAGTRAPFPLGLGDADRNFAHPARFRAGDANVWLGFCSETESVPSGIFSPDFVSWPRREALGEPGGWVTQNCSIDPLDPWGSHAIAKPLIASRNVDIYSDSFQTTITPGQWREVAAD
jgi:predicted amidohydrolase